MNMTLSMKQDLDKVNSRMEMLLQSEDPVMQEVIDYVLQSAGKQLRPCLLMMFSKFGKENEDAAEFAAIVEIIHMASLVHDDIIDDADTRRGQLSVQKKFGRHMAVYAGDFMLFSVLKNCTLKTDRRYQALFASLTNLCYGELGQESLRYNLDVTLDQYIKNITGKTATMFELACELGAALASKNEELVAAAREFGRALGILFQIRDDLLDFDFKSFLNKPTSADFVNGIYTMPLIYTLQNPEFKEKLRAIKEQTREKLSEDNAQEIIRTVNQAKGFEKTRDGAREYYDSAKNALLSIKTKNKEQVEFLLSMLDELIDDIQARCLRYAES